MMAPPAGGTRHDGRRVVRLLCRMRSESLRAGECTVRPWRGLAHDSSTTFLTDLRNRHCQALRPSGHRRPPRPPLPSEAGDADGRQRSGRRRPRRRSHAAHHRLDARSAARSRQSPRARHGRRSLAGGAWCPTTRCRCSVLAEGTKPAIRQHADARRAPPSSRTMPARAAGGEGSTIDGMAGVVPSTRHGRARPL